MNDGACIRGGLVSLLVGAFVLCYAVGQVAAYADQDTKVTLRIGEARGEPGMTVYVPVTLATGGNPVSTILLGVAFDETKLAFYGAEPGQVVLDAGKVIFSGTSEAGNVRLLVLGLTDVTTLRDGALMALVFDVLPDAAPGVVPLRASDVSVASPDATYLDTRAGEGQVAVGSVALVTATPNPAGVEIGQTVQLGATSTDTYDHSFAWASSDPEVAAVSETGLVTGISAGIASVSATGSHSGIAGGATVDVVYSSLVSVLPNPALIEGHTVELTAASDDSEDLTFTWRTADAAVAAISAAGGDTAEVVGVGAGSVVITATGDSSGLQGATTVIVSQSPMVLVTPGVSEIFVEQTVALEAISTDAVDMWFYWESSDPAVADVSSAGVVTGVSEGTATVTATGNHSGLTGEAEITVHTCSLAPPANVTASDGDLYDAVLVEWDAVPGQNIEYRVYRAVEDNLESAAPLGEDWQIGTGFLDESAEPPTVLGVGCYRLPVLEPNYYYYWVAAKSGDACVSGFSESERGYRGARGIIVGGRGDKHALAAGVENAGPFRGIPAAGDFGILLCAASVLGMAGRTRVPALPGLRRLRILRKHAS